MFIHFYHFPSSYPHSAYFWPLWLAAVTSGTQEAVAGSGRSPGTELGGWTHCRLAGMLEAQTERQLGGWLVGLGWQCGR